MAVVTNTLQTFDKKETREDLGNVINDLTPEETPLYSMMSKTKATNVKHEWLWDRSEAGTSSNQVTQGDDPAADAASAIVRFMNYSQLMDKVVRVSSTKRAVDDAGYEDAMAYQMAKRALELRKDLDAALCKNGAATAGAANTPSAMAGLEQWLTYSGRQASGRMTGNGTSLSSSSAATSPGFSTSLGCVSAIVDASAGYATTETMLKGAILNTIVNSSSRVSQLLMHPTLKQNFAANISGIATRYREVPRGQAAIVAGADLYVSNFGDIVLNYSRQMRYDATAGGPAFGLNPKLLACAFLQNFKQEPLAKTGHGDVRMISCEATLEVKDPQGMFKLGDNLSFTAT